MLIIGVYHCNGLSRIVNTKTKICIAKKMQ
jgi:hypothetical protein